MSKIEPMSFRRCVKAVLSGITVSVFTPNRIGEFLGRVFYMDQNRIKGTLIALIGSISQMLMTITIGSIGMLFYMHWFHDTETVTRHLFYIMTFLVILVDTTLFILFLNTPLLTVALKRLRLSENMADHAEVFALYSGLDLVKVTGYSFARYLVFCTQFFLLLHVFGVDVTVIQGMVLIPLIFLAVSLAPMLGAREFFALMFIGGISSQELGIISASFTLWLMNLALPALLGVLFIFGLRFFRNTGQRRVDD